MIYGQYILHNKPSQRQKSLFIEEKLQNSQLYEGVERKYRGTRRSRPFLSLKPNYYS